MRILTCVMVMMFGAAIVVCEPRPAEPARTPDRRVGTAPPAQQPRPAAERAPMDRTVDPAARPQDTQPGTRDGVQIEGDIQTR
jgi:hypothetical protein